MSNRYTAPAGAPTWIDVMTSDLAATQAFYSELFGWTMVDPGPDYNGYFSFHRDGLPVAGGMSNADNPDGGDFWSIYFATADAAATIVTAEANGGTVLLPLHPVEALGTRGVMAGPGGAAAGLWQPAEHTGFGAMMEPGAPNWFELQTRAYDEDLAFYRQTLGWNIETVAEEDGFRYSMGVFGGEGLLGVMDASVFAEDAPLGWSVYFGTNDIDTSIAKAVDLGATLTIGPDHTPYGILAGLDDPTGAAFKLQQVPVES